MYKLSAILVSVLVLTACSPKLSNGLRKSDLTKDVELVTTKGTMVIRLSDSTPLHRDNFLKLVKQHYYDGILFHRVIKEFMVQAGDPKSKDAKPGEPLGEGGPGYTVPAEFRPGLFHKKGVIAAARTGDQVNPSRSSSGSQFYIVQGKVFTDAELNQIEQQRMGGNKLPEDHRQIYKTIGGTPHLDMAYTVFGEVIKGQSVIDSIAGVATNERNRPVLDVRIVKATLVKR
jgi:cyclophilin family peptidyl-prolyl cis-trans isomerase